MVIGMEVFIKECKVNGCTAIVRIPKRTHEEKAIRNKEIEAWLIDIYHQVEARGMGHILLVSDQEGEIKKL